MTPQDRRELLSLFSALCDGELAAEQRDRLRLRLAGDAECRRLYLEFADTHARLLTHPRPGAVERPTPAKTRRRFATALRYVGVSSATVAATLLAQLVLSTAPSRLGSAPPGAAAPHYVATLAQVSKCEWEDPAEPWRSGSRLPPGELRLKSGVAQVRFDGGPDLILEGPAVLRLETAGAATLASGKAVFRGSATGGPFDLRTPSSRLVDIGTEYAVRVGPGGEEIHVFDGEVERTAGAGPESLMAGAAMRYDAGAPGRPTALDPAGFVRAVAAPAPGGDAGLLAYEGFAYADVDAFVAGRADGGMGWVGPWKLDFARPAPAGASAKPIAPTGLTRAGAATPGAGGAFEFTGFTKAFRRMAKPVRLDEDGIHYLSYLFRRGGLGTGLTDAVAILLWTDDDFRERPHTPRYRLNVGVDGPSHEMFTHLHGASARTPVPLSYGETYLMVAKIVASAGGADQVFLKAYGPGEPVGAGEPSSWTVVGVPFESDLAFEWLQVHVNSDARQTIDEIRVGTTWASVMAAWAAPPR